jgi:hypothetical protein
MNSDTSTTFEHQDTANNGSIGSGIAEKVTDVVEQIQEHVAPAVSQTQQKAGEMAGKVGQQAASRLEEHRSQTAQGLSSVAGALRQSSQQVQEKDQGVVTQFAGQYGNVIADQVERVSNYLQDRSTQDLVREVEDFARRDPAIFIGGAFLLGLVGARLLKSAPAVGTSTPSPSQSSNYTPTPPNRSLAVQNGQTNSTRSAGNLSGESLGLGEDDLRDPFYNSDDPVLTNSALTSSPGLTSGPGSDVE